MQRILWEWEARELGAQLAICKCRVANIITWMLFEPPHQLSTYCNVPAHVVEAAALLVLGF